MEHSSPHHSLSILLHKGAFNTVHSKFRRKILTLLRPEVKAVGPPAQGQAGLIAGVGSEDTLVVSRRTEQPGLHHVLILGPAEEASFPLRIDANF